MKLRKIPFILSATSALLIAPTVFAQNQNGTWNVTTTPASWTNSANWLGGTIADGAGFTANFNALNITADTTVNLNGARTIGHLVFGDTDTSTAGTWSINAAAGVALTLDASTPSITVNALGTDKFGRINAILGGSGGFTKNGNGNLLLTNAGNTISGQIVISQGNVQLNAAALTNATSVAINGGNLVIATSSANAIGGTIAFGGGTLQYNNDPGSDYSGQFSTAANQHYRINSGSSRVVTFSSNLSSAGGRLTKGSAGTLVLNAANTFTGATTVSGGTLQLNNALALQNSAIDTAVSLAGTTASGIVLSGVTTPTFGGLTGDKPLASLFDTDTGNYGSMTELTLNPNTGASHLYSGAIANGAANMKLTKTGEGMQTLTGANTYTGDTTVNQGTLIIGVAGVGGTAAGSAVTVAAGTATSTPVAKLGGTGTIGGAVSLSAESAVGLENGGVLAPTAAASGTKLSVAGTTTFGAGSIFEWNMSAANPAEDPVVDTNSGSYSQLAGTGAVTGSNAVFKIVLAAGNAFTDSFWNSDKIWDDVFGGAGATTDLTSIFSSFGGSGGITPTGEVFGRGQFSLTSTSTLTWTAVPEPTGALAGLLLASGILGRRRR